MRAFIGMLALLGCVAAKKKQKSEFVELTEVQAQWHRLWGEAAPGVSHACKEVNEFIQGTGCNWEKMLSMEKDLRNKSEALLGRKPEFSAALAEMLKTTPALDAKLAAAEGAPQAVAAAAQAASDKIPCNAMTCKTRDDFCFCARSQGQMWEFDCAIGGDKTQETACRAFLGSVCSVDFPEDEELEDFEGLDEFEKKQKDKRKENEKLNGCTDSSEDCAAWAGDGECSKNPAYMLYNCCKSCKAKGLGVSAEDDENAVSEQSASDSAFNKKLLELKQTMQDVEDERNALADTRGKQAKGKSGQRLLSNLDARLLQEKNKIAEQMKELTEKHERLKAPKPSVDEAQAKSEPDVQV